MTTYNGAPTVQAAPETTEIRENHVRGQNPNQADRYQRSDFSKFNVEDINDWLYKVEQFFDYERILKENRVQTTSINMEGKTLQWHKMYMKPEWGDSQIRKLILGQWPRKFNKIDSKPAFQGSKRLSAKEIDDKRANDLCYYCNEKYTPEHNFSRRKQFFILELDEEIEESLWSTHNFMDLAVAKKLVCRLKTIPFLSIFVAVGSKVYSSVMTTWVTWKMQGVDFKANMLVITLGGADVVLSIQYLITLGDIRWNFKQLKMEFQIGGRKEVNPVQEARVTSNSQEVQSSEDLQKVFQQYAPLFVNPIVLPPHRAHDHKIILMEGVSPINVRTYRYLASQKDEIEKMMAEMLESGIIRPNRLGIDYRKLNDCIVKDKFPIPVIEELLDELGGSEYFSKWDLRFGYHLIRMDERDIKKTTFRSHNGHYEFVIVPFGLSNAPSTFQSLMNKNFHSYLRTFILVFFDDILIYSPSWSEHLVHLQNAFDVLQEHNLFMKLGKCSFKKPGMEYLGHIITQQGVAVDPGKVQVMRDWPIPQNLKELRGFLGLTGYYRRFVKSYGIQDRPLTKLLKKNKFGWPEEAAKAFQKLKQAMSIALHCQTFLLSL
ncbi:uncharacterized protein LOC142170158 [Nicotiana tabacum]|uniref:Uncharacterized protein LOC142170158 n=1 Tax=Nicotiana tabacum TaxID=4097 RepID=A0AC58ST01_TOBAC